MTRYASPRPATQTDADGVAALLTELGYPTAPSVARTRLGEALEDPKSLVLVVDGSERIIALLTAHVAPYFPDGSRLCRVTALVVAGSERGNGIGRVILEHGITIAADRGCKAVEITTAEHRSAAHAFYERLGFKRTSIRFLRTIGDHEGAG